MRSPPQIPLYSAEDTFATDQQPAISRANEWSPVIVSSLQGSPTHSLLQSTPIDTFYGRESMSFTSVGVLSNPVSADTFRTGYTG